MGIGMAIAAFKASLVALIFMHLSTDWHNRMIKIFLIFAAVFFVALMMLTIWGKYNPIKALFQ
jgi:caa(3)-type oxidase subunit IV